MKVLIHLSCDPELYARARQEISNISCEFENFLRAELDLGKAKDDHDKLELARIQVAKLTKALEEVTKERDELKKQLEGGTGYVRHGKDANYKPITRIESPKFPGYGTTNSKQ